MLTFRSVHVTSARGLMMHSESITLLSSIFLDVNLKLKAWHCQILTLSNCTKNNLKGLYGKSQILANTSDLDSFQMLSAIFISWGLSVVQEYQLSYHILAKIY